MKHLSRFGLVAICVVLALVSVGVTSAEELRSTEFYIVTGVELGGDCSSFSISTHRFVGTDRRLTMLVIQNGVIVQDFAGTFSGLNGVSGLGVFHQNSRGLAPVNVFPLAAGVKIEIIIGLWTNEWEPLYEWRGRVKDCSDLTIPLKKVQYGPAHMLTQNHSFEAVGLDAGGVTDNNLAAYWKPKNAANDTRQCGGSDAYVGNCGLDLVADLLVASKFKNIYNGTVGADGDNLLLNFYANPSPGYAGAGKVKAKAVLADGSVIKFSIPIPTSPAGYTGMPYFAWEKLSAPIVSAKVVIKQGIGSGSVSLDSVSLSVFTNAHGTRALPVPAARDSSSGHDNQ
ncbi:MAG: hypothetical protein IPM16_19045 [Chloroflexi bacterium]|nr:hypothetical protein [Chloroflexota bacterium]